MIETLREAMVGAVHEIAASSDTATLAAFIDVVKTIREEMVLTYMTDEYVKQHVWGLVRKDTILMKSILHGVANFSMCIDDLPGAIKLFANKAVCFTKKSVIVDDDLMGKSVEQKDLEGILTNNHWLFFLLFCSTHLYLINQVGIMYIPMEPKKNA